MPVCQPRVLIAGMIPDGSEKRSLYAEARTRLSGLLEGEPDGVARMAGVVAVLHGMMPHYYWTGFYRVVVVVVVVSAATVAAEVTVQAGEAWGLKRPAAEILRAWARVQVGAGFKGVWQVWERERERDPIAPPLTLSLSLSPQLPPPPSPPPPPPHNAGFRSLPNIPLRG